MKNILLSISILFSINCFSQQPNPDLFQTWYLYRIDASDSGPTPAYIISEIDPAITPTLTFMEDLTFNGVAACNTFNGNLSLLNSSEINTEQYSFTTDDCGVQIHTNFENEYNEFIQTMRAYSISQVNNGLELYIDTMIFGYATFRNFQLNIAAQELQHIEIYPNPTSSLLHLKSQNTQIFEIEIFNALGQSIKRFKNNFDTLNISELPNGMYILKLYTDLGIINKKIVKQ